MVGLIVTRLAEIPYPTPQLLALPLADASPAVTVLPTRRGTRVLIVTVEAILATNRQDLTRTSDIHPKDVAVTKLRKRVFYF